MAFEGTYSYAATAIVVAATFLFLLRRTQKFFNDWRSSKHSLTRVAYPLETTPPSELPKHIQELLASLPKSVILQSDIAAFREALDYSWAQPNREIIPSAFVRPRTAQELGTAVAILAREHTRRGNKGAFFGVRSGGANPSFGGAAGRGGVVIDLSRFRELGVSEDRSTVTIGVGARWMEVYESLKWRGLTVAGGRTSPVGVGGLSLHGGISLYSGQSGFVCSNVLEYEMVVASGEVITVSAKQHPELFRALKGSAGNFGLVTRVTLPVFPSEPVWTTHVYALAWSKRKLLKDLYNYLADAGSDRPGAFDEHASPPLVTIGYVQAINLNIVFLALGHTKPEPGNGTDPKQWPAVWKRTGFTDLFAVKRVGGVHDNCEAARSLGDTAEPGCRAAFGTTTIRNDLAMINETYDIFCQRSGAMRSVSGMVLTSVFQGVLPQWMNKGRSANVLSLKDCKEPLIIFSFSVTWHKAEDDEYVRKELRRMIELIEEAGARRGMGHPYRFLNYCSEWQRPFDGRNEEDLTLMRQMCRKYDPQGVFEDGCAGGFKLPSGP